MEFQVDHSIFSQVEAVSNKTKMFVSCKRRLSVYDFWKDGSAQVLIEDNSEDNSEDDPDEYYEDDSGSDYETYSEEEEENVELDEVLDADTDD